MSTPAHIHPVCGLPTPPTMPTEIEVHTRTFLPGFNTGKRRSKRQRHLQCLGQSSSRPRILCGDFNTPKEEMPWMHRDLGSAKGEKRVSGLIDPKRGKDWDEAERTSSKDWSGYDLADVFRSLTGTASVIQLVLERQSERGNEAYHRRYDHRYLPRRP